MTSDPSGRIEEVFGEALERTPEERASFLDVACAGDATLQGEVESLLRHHGQASADFLRPPTREECVLSTPLDKLSDPLVGTDVGDFRIKGVIASGGMGTVYEAVQEKPRRVVALKVMRVGLTSKRALRRFEFESEILSRMRHPNIAQVYQAGVHNPAPPNAVGTPYFAMEHIPEARTITEYCRDERLDVTARLEMFIKVCEAVHHGHQKGIIHRDLKPANILVDAHGEPKVIDFGVARSTDADIALTTMQTDVGQLVGTLQYMSPEQCDADVLDIDTRSDVYSLGVILYELLTGKLPYDVSDSAIQQATQVIRVCQPDRPSAIDARLRGDVETIVLKALEKDRERRYQSATDLGQDVKRYLRREPIHARPPTTWSRTIHWVTRHPVATTTTTCLVAGAIVLAGTWLMVWLVNERPFSMAIADDGSQARLLSYTDRILSTRKVEEPGQIGFAELVPSPTDSATGPLALIGFRHAQSNEYPGALCAFDAERGLEDVEPVWIRRIEDGDIPSDSMKRPLAGSDFGVRWCKVVDIFPERAGPEIVVIHSCAFSADAIRILDRSGEVLYQVWHDGALGSCHWMSQERLLVFSGLNSVGNWKNRGHPAVATFHPHVVFAVRPILDFVTARFLQPEPGNEPINPVWYKCLLPPKVSDVIDGGRWGLAPPAATRGSGRFVDVYMHLTQFGADLRWTIDEFGVEVPGTRVLTDTHIRHVDELPDPNVIRLGELPPIVAAGEVTASQSNSQNSRQ